MRLEPFSICAIALISLLNFSADIHAESKEKTMNSIQLLANLRPWCVGRFVMDRPANSRIHAEDYEFWGLKFSNDLNVTEGTFQHKVETRENELRRKMRTTYMSYREMLAKGLKSAIIETNTPWLEKAATPSKFSRIFVFTDDAKYPDRAFKQEGYALAGSTMLSAKSLVKPSDVDGYINRISDVYRQITYRDNWSIPNASGFCVNGALIGGPYRNSEEVEQSIVLQPGRPSLFLIHMRDAVDVDEQSSLLNNLPSLEQELSRQGYSSAVKILRKGKRTVAGMEAEEVLFSLQENGVQLYRFNLLVPGKAKSGAHPHTTIQLNFGNVPKHGLPPEQATSPVDEAGAFEVWDTLLNSMRLRPGAL